MKGFGWAVHVVYLDESERTSLSQIPTKSQLVRSKDAVFPSAGQWSNSFSGLGGASYLQCGEIFLRLSDPVILMD